MDFPFNSDACSNPLQYISDKWADLNFGQACVWHDWAYWSGGPRNLRKEADIALRGEIRRAGHPALAHVYYWAVRLFGWLPFSDRWSWGYGWDISRRGTDTLIPRHDTPYTTLNQRHKLEALLREAA